MKRKKVETEIKEIEMYPGFPSRRAVDALFEPPIEDEMRQQHDSVAVVPPTPGWRLIAHRQFQTGTQQFNVGCEVPVESLGKNFRAFLSGHYVEWHPPSVPITVTAKPLPPPPAPPKGNPPIEIIHDLDAVASWKATVSLMTERCDGNAARARAIC